MPPNTIYVGRPTKYANQFDWRKYGRAAAKADFKRQLRNWESDDPAGLQQALDELRGHDLACWCPLDEPCHADIWLKLANPPQ
jgi:hypothetical protein